MCAIEPPEKHCSEESESIGKEYVNNWGKTLSLLNTHTEEDVLKLLDLLEDVRQKWQKSEAECEKYKTTAEILQKENQDIRKENESLADRLRNCQLQLSNVSNSKRDVEEELEESKRRWNKLPSHIKISSPTPLATLDEDDMEAKENFPTDDEKTEECSEVNISTDTPKKLLSRMRRSVSVPLVNKSRDSTSDEDGNETANSLKNIPNDSKPPTTPTCSNLYQNMVERRVHDFVSKRVFTKVICCMCETTVRFGIEASKCQTCKSIYHQHCRYRAPVPCIPWSSPKKATKETGRLRLGDYCAENVVPKLPHLIIRCVQYLNQEKLAPGIYTDIQLPSEADLLLKLLLRERSPPALKTYGPQVVAHCIIKFLSDIRESLIPESSIKEFLDASKTDDNFDMDTVISELPFVHKSTLAYLFMHWKLLNQESDINGLTSEVLGTALIPVIMRGTASDVSTYLPVFDRLLSFSNLYWEDVIEQEMKFLKHRLSRQSSKKTEVDISRSVTVAKLNQGDSARRKGNNKAG
jgi:ribosomal protein L40E